MRKPDYAEMRHMLSYREAEDMTYRDIQEMLFIKLSINKIKNNMWGNYKSYLAYQSKGDE